MNWKKIVLVVVIVMPAALASADTLWVGAPGRKGMENKDVKIVRVTEGMVVFRTAGGNETSRSLSQIQKMHIEDETTFNTAEDAYANGDFAGASTGYNKTLKGTDKEWLKRWCSVRLMEAARQSDQFENWVNGFIALAASDSASAANALRPKMPDAGSALLNSSSKALDEGLKDVKLSEPSKRLLLQLKLDIDTLRNDPVEVNSDIKSLLPLLRGTGDPTAMRQLAELRLSVVKFSLVEKKWTAAMNEIQENKSLFTDPAHHATALFFLAEAKYGQAGNSADAGTLKDIALDYMKVVANFPKGDKDFPARQYIAKALYQVAVIHERIKEPATAFNIYQQVASQYADQSDTAQLAKQAAERLKPQVPQT